MYYLSMILAFLKVFFNRLSINRKGLESFRTSFEAYVRIYLLSFENKNSSERFFGASEWVLFFFFLFSFCVLMPNNQHWYWPVGWGCRIHWLHLNEYPVYDTKLSVGEVPVMLEFGGIQRTPSLPSLPGPFWPGVVAPDRVLYMGQIEINCILMLNWIAWNRTVLVSKLCTYAKLNYLK